MAPPPKPTSIDNFFANYQSPILLSAFGAQVGHYQFIKRTQPVADANISLRAPAIPRTLRAGLGWAVVFVGLLTQITLAKKTVRDHSDPVLAVASDRKQWPRKAHQGL